MGLQIGQSIGGDLETLKAVDASAEDNDLIAQMRAVMRSRLALDLSLDGTILGANHNFLAMFGFSSQEIVGRHHDIFLEEKERNSQEYREYWNKLTQGEFQVLVCKRIAKDGREIWLTANYNPIFRKNGQLYMIQMLGTDITARALRDADSAGQSQAVHRAMQVVEYALDGKILDINANGEKLFGYSRAELVGRPYDVLVDETTRRSPEYKEASRQLWEKLGRGECASGEGKRNAKNGQEIWIQYSYNPILDLKGKPYKVVNYFTDVTHWLQTSREIERIGISLADAADRLISVSGQMSSDAVETAQQANVGLSGAEHVNSSLHTVASGTEEVSSSIKEIDRNAHESAKMATSAVQMVEETNQIVSKLGDSSREIGNVVKVITAVAQQTNLLALNATIEAARAGDAGKGFAVVANEVKELAKQTAKSSGDIGRMVDAIQGDTKGAIAAISQIRDTIRQVNEVSGTIAAAVREQNTTTGEVARNVSEAAQSTNQIVKNVTSVAKFAEATSVGAAETQKSAQSLTQMASQLRLLVSRFKG